MDSLAGAMTEALHITQPGLLLCLQATGNTAAMKPCSLACGDRTNAVDQREGAARISQGQT
jgi:hypothetical protein